MGFGQHPPLRVTFAEERNVEYVEERPTADGGGSGSSCYTSDDDERSDLAILETVAGGRTRRRLESRRDDISSRTCSSRSIEKRPTRTSVGTDVDDATTSARAARRPKLFICNESPSCLVRKIKRSIRYFC